MALLVVLSVFSGLDSLTLTFSNAIDPDLVVLPKTGKKIVITDSQDEDLQNLREVATFSKLIEDRVVFTYGDKQIVANIKAVDSNYINVIPILDYIVYGEWFREYSNEVVQSFQNRNYQPSSRCF